MSKQTILNGMRRCLVNQYGNVLSYLDPGNSMLLEGTTWQDNQQASEGTEGLTITGSFPHGMEGIYVENVTKGFSAQVLSATSSELTMHYPLQTTGTNWSVTDGATTDKLVDNSATFTQDVNVGDIVALRDLSDHAIITNIDSDTQLSVSKDLFPLDTKYTIMRGFEEGDEIQLGTAQLDGSMGHVMVEIPAYYYKFESVNDKPRWFISAVPQAGYELHPAFVNGDKKYSHLYISAFEAAVNSRGQGEERLTSYDLGSAKLNSYAGFQPVTSGQRSEFRQAAGNIGPDWQIIDWYSNWAWQLLFMAEYESLDSQSALGDGVTNWSASRWREDYNNGDYWALSHNGFSLKEGNNSVNADGGGDNIGGYLTYRGIENPWGNIFKWIDGVNYNDGQVYLCDDHNNFEDDTSEDPYFDTGVIQPDNTGYISKIHQTKHGLLVAEASGSSSSYLPDRYYYNPGWRVARGGGAANRGSRAGFACLAANHSSSSRNSNIGSRVCLKK